ncbi:MAG: hypothetical protein AAFR61_27715 [Bacteroidota bacterium]
MKTFTLLLISFFLSSLSGFAQDWHPIPVGDTLVYVDAAGWCSVVFADSTRQVGPRRIYYLHPHAYTIIYDSRNDGRINYHFDRPGPLKQELHELEDGIFQFITPDSLRLSGLDSLFWKMDKYRPYLMFYADTLTIHTLAGLGESWSISPHSNRTATVVGITSRMIEGKMDSVKRILLDDSTHILLSKSHGLVSIDSVQLIGRFKPDEPKPYPDFWQIFDFNIGDKFWSVRYDSTQGEWYRHWANRQIEEYEIVGKTQDSAGFIYDVKYWGRERDILFDLTRNPPEFLEYKYLGVGEVQEMRIYESSYPGLRYPYQNVLYRKMAGYNPSHFMGQSRANEEAYFIQVMDNLSPLVGIHHLDREEYRPGLGLVRNRDEVYGIGFKRSSRYEYDLVGWEKDGILYGKDLSWKVRQALPVPPPPVLPTPPGPKEFRMFHRNLDYSVIHFRVPDELTPLHFEIWDISGRQMGFAALQDLATMDISHLLAGRYYWRATSSQGEFVDAGIFHYMP